MYLSSKTSLCRERKQTELNGQSQNFKKMGSENQN